MTTIGRSRWTNTTAIVLPSGAAPPTTAAPPERAQPHTARTERSLSSVMRAAAMCSRAGSRVRHTHHLVQVPAPAVFKNRLPHRRAVPVGLIRAVPAVDLEQVLHRPRASILGKELPRQPVSVLVARADFRVRVEASVGGDKMPGRAGLPFVREFLLPR